MVRFVAVAGPGSTACRHLVQRADGLNSDRIRVSKRKRLCAIEPTCDETRFLSYGTHGPLCSGLLVCDAIGRAALPTQKSYRPMAARKKRPRAPPPAPAAPSKGTPVASEAEQPKAASRSLASYFPDSAVLQLADSWKQHPLVAGRVFFALPSDLLDLVLRELKPGSISEEAKQLEQAMSTACEQEPDIVGSWGDQKICYRPLALKPIEPPPEADIAAMAASSRDDSEGIRTAYRQAVRRQRREHEIACAYAGWLLTNSEFLGEHDALFGRWQAELKSGRSVPSFPRADFDQWEIPQVDQTGRSIPPGYFEDFYAFFRRWRLAGMAGPLLPIPLTPELPVLSSRRLVDYRHHASRAIFIPDIWPLPTRDDLQGRLEEAIRGASPPEHLAAWIGWVGSANRAKNILPKLARRCRLAHFWRVIHSRHADRLGRSKEKLIDAFAEYLEVDAKTLKRDVAEIKDRLGPNWAVASHGGL